MKSKFIAVAFSYVLGMCAVPAFSADADIEAACSDLNAKTMAAFNLEQDFEPLPKGASVLEEVVIEIAQHPGEFLTCAAGPGGAILYRPFANLSDEFKNLLRVFGPK